MGPDPFNRRVKGPPFQSFPLDSMRQQEFQPPAPKKDQSGQTTSALLPSRYGRSLSRVSDTTLTAAAGGGATLADLFTDRFAFGRARLARGCRRCCGASPAPAALPRDAAGGFLEDLLQHCVDDA